MLGKYSTTELYVTILSRSNYYYYCVYGMYMYMCVYVQLPQHACQMSEAQSTELGVPFYLHLMAQTSITVRRYTRKLEGKWLYLSLQFLRIYSPPCQGSCDGRAMRPAHKSAGCQQGVSSPEAEKRQGVGAGYKSLEFTPSEKSKALSPKGSITFLNIATSQGPSVSRWEPTGGGGHFTLTPQHIDSGD